VADGGNITNTASNDRHTEHTWAEVGLGPHALRDGLDGTDFEVVELGDRFTWGGACSCDRTPIAEWAARRGGPWDDAVVPQQRLKARLRRALTEGPVTPALRVAWAVAGLLLFFSVYGGVGLLTAGGAADATLLPLPIDAWVPFMPVGTLAYVALYPQVLAPLFLVEDRRMLLRGASAYLLMIAISVPVWVLMPVTVHRIPVPVEDLFTWGLWVTRAVDPPTNCFPSMHVAESFCAAFVVGRCDKRLGRAMLVIATLIWWSTMALGQHWFVDGVAGLLVAVVVDRLVFAWRPAPAEVFRIGPPRRLLLSLGLYVLIVLGAAVPWWAGLVDPASLPAPSW
jgi:membrane-associated phospholipid phosphatase